LISIIFQSPYLVEDPEDQRGELGGIAVGEKLCVDLGGRRILKKYVGAVLQKSLVPLLDLLLGNCTRRNEEAQMRLRKLASSLTVGLRRQTLQGVVLELGVLLAHDGDPPDLGLLLTR